MDIAEKVHNITEDGVDDSFYDTFGMPRAIREKQNSDPENNPNNPIQKKRKRFFRS